MKGSRVSKLFPQVGISEKRRFYRYHEPSLNRLIRNPKISHFFALFDSASFSFDVIASERKKERNIRKSSASLRTWVKYVAVND